MAEDEIEVPQVDEFDDSELDEPVEPVAPVEPPAPTMEERRKAALEFVRENPDVLSEIMPPKAAKDDEQEEPPPDFETTAQMAKWIEDRVSERVAKALSTQTGTRQSLAAKAKAQLRSEFGADLPEAEIEEIANLYLDPNVSTEALGQSFTSGAHLHVAKSRAYDALKTRRTESTSTGEPVGGRGGGASARARQIQEALKRQGVTVDAKTAERYAREEVQ